MTYEDQPQRQRILQNLAHKILKISETKLHIDLKIAMVVYYVALQQRITLLKRKYHSGRI